MRFLKEDYEQSYDELNSYLEENGIYGYTEAIAMRADYSKEDLNDYLEYEGIIGYTDDIYDILNEYKDPEEETHTCVICGKEFQGYGNNAEPVEKGKCCDNCNRNVVIPARLEEFKKGVGRLDLAEDLGLTERIPKDLARAYRKDKYKAAAMSHHEPRQTWGQDIDYEKVQYKEITPEEALKYKKMGEITNLRLLINGNLIEFDPYTSRSSVDYDLPWGKEYTTKSGNTVRSVKLTPFAHLVQVADKIYYTDSENKVKSPIDPDKLKRLETTDDYRFKRNNSSYYDSYGDVLPKYGNIRQLGKHKDRDDWSEREARWAKEAIQNRKDDLVYYKSLLDSGRISQEDYDKKVTYLNDQIKKETDKLYRELGNAKDNRKRLERQYSEIISQANINKYKALKYNIKQAEDQINKLNTKLDDIRENGSEADTYSYERKRLSELMSQLKSIQHDIAYYQAKLNDSKTNSDIKEAEDNLAEQEKLLKDATDDLNKLLKRV